jgi:hypothetical protein
MINTAMLHRTENRMNTPGPTAEEARAKRTAFVSWIAVAISLLALLLANGPMP